MHRQPLRAHRSAPHRRDTRATLSSSPRPGAQGRAMGTDHASSAVRDADDHRTSEGMMFAWICALLAAFASSGVIGAAQKSSTVVWWPQFRGPNASGLGAGRPPVHFGPDQNVLWKIPVGTGLSSPIVWDDRIFLTELDQATKQLSTLCIDRRTGKVLWRRAVSPDQL